MWGVCVCVGPPPHLLPHVCSVGGGGVGIGGHSTCGAWPTPRPGVGVGGLMFRLVGV